jgi:hypothetical protein
VRLVVLLPVLVLPVAWLIGCDPPPSSSQVRITTAQARKFLKEGDKSVKAFRGGVVADAKQAAAAARDVVTASTQDLRYLNFTGTARLVAPRGAHGFNAFGKGSFRGGGKVGYISTSDALKGDGEILLKFSARGAGSACVRFTGSTDLTQQYVTGSFDVLGGSGAAARLHDKGSFRAVQPTAFINNRYDVALFGVASLGAKRPVPKGCGKPIHAPHQRKFTATFDGFAFAPASARNGRLPAGTKLYPQGSISGMVGCGVDNSLYVITTYSGPRGALFAGSASANASGKQATLQQALKQGQNAVFLFAAPPNGSYQLKADVIPPRGATGSAVFGQEVTLQRSC